MTRTHPAAARPAPRPSPTSRPAPLLPAGAGWAPAAPALRARLARLIRDDEGMSTVEYAVGTVAAAAFAALLYAIVSGDDIIAALTGIVQRALSTTF